MVIDYLDIFDSINNVKHLLNNFNENIKFNNFIEYDPVLDKDNNKKIKNDRIKKYCDYRIIKACSHDGTLLFTYELILDTLLPLLNHISCPINMINNPAPLKYKVGKLRLETHSISYKNEHGIWMNTRNITSIPVKCIY